MINAKPIDLDCRQLSHLAETNRTARPRHADANHGRQWCQKVTPKRFPMARQHGPQFHHPWRHDRSCSNGLACNRGDKAMWIVLYVAMIASFRAMGLAVVPVETDKERGPYSDM
jgi:hypothetical protein